MFSVDGIDPQHSFGFVLRVSVNLYSCSSHLLYIPGCTVVGTTRADHSEHLKPHLCMHAILHPAILPHGSWLCYHVTSLAPTGPAL